MRPTPIYSGFLVLEEGIASTFRALLEVFRQHGLPLSLSRQVLKARILLKADASEAGEAWSDGQITEVSGGRQ